MLGGILPLTANVPAHYDTDFVYMRVYYGRYLRLTRAPLGGGYFEPPSRFLAVSSKPMQVSPPNLQYPLSQQFYILCEHLKVQDIIVRPQMTSE